MASTVSNTVKTLCSRTERHISRGVASTASRIAVADAFTAPIPTRSYRSSTSSGSSSTRRRRSVASSTGTVIATSSVSSTSPLAPCPGQLQGARNAASSLGGGLNQSGSALRSVGASRRRSRLAAPFASQAAVVQHQGDEIAPFSHSKMGYSSGASSSQQGASHAHRMAGEHEVLHAAAKEISALASMHASDHELHAVPLKPTVILVSECGSVDDLRAAELAGRVSTGNKALDVEIRRCMDPFRLISVVHSAFVGHARAERGELSREAVARLPADTRVNLPLTSPERLATLLHALRNIESRLTQATSRRVGGKHAANRRARRAAEGQRGIERSDDLDAASIASLVRRSWWSKPTPSATAELRDNALSGRPQGDTLANVSYAVSLTPAGRAASAASGGAPDLLHELLHEAATALSGPAASASAATLPSAVRLGCASSIGRLLRKGLLPAPSLAASNVISALLGSHVSDGIANMSRTLSSATVTATTTTTANGVGGGLGGRIQANSTAMVTDADPAHHGEESQCSLDTHGAPDWLIEALRSSGIMVDESSSSAEAQTLVRLFESMRTPTAPSIGASSAGRDGVMQAAGNAAGARGGALHLISGSALDGADSSGVSASLATGLAKAGCVDARLAGEIATSAVNAFARSVGMVSGSTFDGKEVRGRVPGAVYNSSASAGSAGSFRPELAASGATSLAVTARAVSSMLIGSAFGSHAAAAPAGPLGSRALQPSHLALPAELGVLDASAHVSASSRRLSPLVSSDAASLASLTEGSIALALLVSECAANSRYLSVRDLADVAQAASMQLSISRALRDAGVPFSEVLPATTATLQSLATLLQQAEHVVKTTCRAVESLEAAVEGSMPTLPPHRRRDEANFAAAAEEAMLASQAPAVSSNSESGDESQSDDVALVTALLSDSEDDRQSDTDDTWHSTRSNPSVPGRAELRAMLEEASTASNLIGAGAAAAASSLSLAQMRSDSESLEVAAITAAAATVVDRCAALEAPTAALLSALPVLAPVGSATTTPVSRVSASAAAAFSALEGVAIALGRPERLGETCHVLDACAVVAAVEHGDAGVVGGLERLARAHEAEQSGISGSASLGIGVLGTDVSLLRLMGPSSLFGAVSDDVRSLTVSAGAWSTLSDAAIALSTPSVMLRHQDAARALVSDAASLIAAGGATATEARSTLKTAVNDVLSSADTDELDTAAAIEVLVGRRVLVGGGVDAAASISQAAVIAEEEGASLTGRGALAEEAHTLPGSIIQKQLEEDEVSSGSQAADSEMLLRRRQVAMGGAGDGNGALLKRQGSAAAAAFAAEAISGFIALAAMVGLGAGSALAMVLWGVVEAEMDKALPEWARTELERQKKAAMRSVALPDVFMPAVAMTDALEEEATFVVTQAEAEATAEVVASNDMQPQASEAAQIAHVANDGINDPEACTALPAEPSPMQEAAAALLVAHAKARSASITTSLPVDIVIDASAEDDVPSFLWDETRSTSQADGVVVPIGGSVTATVGPIRPEALPFTSRQRVRDTAARGRQRLSLVAGSAESAGGWQSRRCDDMPGVTRLSRRSRFEDSRAANPMALPASDTVSLGWLLGGTQPNATNHQLVSQPIKMHPAAIHNQHRSRGERRVLSGSMSGATSLSAMLAEPVGPETIESVRMHSASGTLQTNDCQHSELDSKALGRGAGYLRYLEEQHSVVDESDEVEDACDDRA